MRYHLTCIIIILISPGFAQKFTPVSSELFEREMNPVINQLNQENIMLRFKKETFPDLKAAVPIESVNGVIYRGQGTVYKMIVAGITVLQTTEYAIFIDSTERLVQISDIDSTMKATQMASQFSKEMLEQYDLERSDQGSYVILKATPKYLDEGVMEFYIDSKRKSLYKMLIMLPSGNYFMDDDEDETIESPYVSIVYEPIIPLKKNQISFSDESILIKDKENNLSLTSNMEGYQLHDSRYRPKK